MAPRVRNLIAEHAAEAEIIMLPSRRAARLYIAALRAQRGYQAPPD
ncbi:MAG TPA: hypothetical protein VGG25_20620 [Streptosporangiaceae bacterium]